MAKKIFFITTFLLLFIMVASSEQNGYGGKRTGSVSSHKSDTKGDTVLNKQTGTESKTKTSLREKRDYRLDPERERFLSNLNNTFIVIDEALSYVKALGKVSVKVDTVKEDFVTICNNLKEKIFLIKEQGNFLNTNLSLEQKNVTKSQLKTVEQSEKRIFQLEQQIEKEINNERINKKAVVSFVVELEKEISKIDRQYRAVQWIIENL